MTTRTTHEVASGRGFPLDTPLVVLYVAAVTAIVLSGASVVGGPLRVLVGLPLLLFLPGYALLAVLYPGRRRDPAAGTTTGETVAGYTGVFDREGLTWGERAAISVGVSMALLPLLAVLLSVAQIPLDPVPITLSLGAVTVLGAIVGALRRLQLPPAERLRLPTHRWSAELRAATLEAPSWAAALLNVVLLLAIVAAVTGLAYGLVAPPAGPDYTEAALLTEQGNELVAGNYTTEFSRGESATTVLTLQNQEGGPRSYTVAVVLERVRGSGGNFAVVERRELKRFTMNVPEGVTARRPVTVTPRMLGENLRLSYYVYAGDAPKNPSPEGANKHLYIWVDVGRGGSGNSSAALRGPSLAGAA